MKASVSHLKSISWSDGTVARAPPHVFWETGSRSAAPGLSPDLRGGVPPGLPVGRRLGHGSEAKGRSPSSAPGCAGPGGTPGPPRAVPAAEPERREWSGRVGVRRTPLSACSQSSECLPLPSPRPSPAPAGFPVPGKAGVAARALQPPARTAAPGRRALTSRTAADPGRTGRPTSAGTHGGGGRPWLGQRRMTGAKDAANWRPGWGSAGRAVRGPAHRAADPRGPGGGVGRGGNRRSKQNCFLSLQPSY